MSDDRDRLAANDNEDAAEDDDVEAHGIRENANEDAVEDEARKQRPGENANEDAAEDD
jgi:hypothetical protein